MKPQTLPTDDQDGTPPGSAGRPTTADPIADRGSVADRSRDVAAIGDDPSVRRIEDLPKDVGVMLFSVGALGMVLPGLMGAPAMIAGGLVLWPKTFGGLEGWLRRRNPGLHGRGMQQLGRFLDDLERRYPDPKK